MLDGLLTDIEIRDYGSSALQAAAIGETTLTVSDLTDFSADGGMIDIDGETYPYDGAVEVGGNIIDDEGELEAAAAGMLLLAEPLRVEVAESDPVRLMAGDQAATEVYAVVDLGGAAETNLDDAGDLVRIPIGYLDRAVWPVGHYEPPWPILVTDDLSSIEAVPGMAPVIDGGLIDPDTLPDAGGGTDGQAPAESPTPDVVGAVTTVHLSWVPVENPDPVTYRVYVSTATPVVIDETTLAATTTSTFITLAALPDGAPFTQQTVYHFVVVALDEDGEAAPGPEGTGGLHPIDVEDFAAGYIYAGEIYADQIVGGTIRADLALANRITTGPPGTPRVDIGPDGITLYALSDGEEFVEVLLPTDPEQSATFSGDVIASTLTVVDGSAFRGEQNAVARSSAFVLDDKLTAPTSPPSVDVGWASTAMNDGEAHPDSSGVERYWAAGSILAGISVASFGPYAGKVLATQPVPATATAPAGEVLWGYDPTSETLEVLDAPTPPQPSFAATVNVGDDILGTPMSATLYLGGLTSGTAIDWGDGAVDTYPNGSDNTSRPRTHTYDESGTYQVQIWGGFASIGNSSQTAPQMAPLISVDIWGESGTTSTVYAFRQVSNLTDVAAPPSSVTNMSSMFRNAAFNGDLSGWDTSSVTNMSYMFGNAAFNGDLSGWDTSSVTNMSSMFGNARSFSQDLSGWNVANVQMHNNFATGSAMTPAQMPHWPDEAT